jgi:hypothetical protein
MRTWTAGLLIAAFAVAGLLFGGALALFLDGDSNGPDGGSEPARTNVIRALDSEFRDKQITLPPDVVVEMTITNEGRLPHTWFLFAEGVEPAPGARLLDTCIEGCRDDAPEVASLTLGAEEETQLTFRTPASGEYEFYCSVHPSTMRGTLIVEEAVE